MIHEILNPFFNKRTDHFLKRYEREPTHLDAYILIDILDYAFVYNVEIDAKFRNFLQITYLELNSNSFAYTPGLHALSLVLDENPKNKHCQLFENHENIIIISKLIHLFNENLDALPTPDNLINKSVFHFMNGQVLRSISIVKLLFKLNFKDDNANVFVDYLIEFGSRNGMSPRISHETKDVQRLR